MPLTRKIVLGGFTNWDQEPDGPWIAVTQTGDLAADTPRLWYRVDPAENLYPILNLFAQVVIGGAGTPSGDIVLNFATVLADIFPSFVVPDFFQVSGYVTINNAGLFSLAYTGGTALLQVFGPTGANVGGTITLADTDILLVNVLAACRDSN